jgi:endonuclease G
MRRTLNAPLVLTLWIIATSALAAGSTFDSCLDFFPNNIPPVVSKSPRMLARELCFDAFAVLHSGVSKTPVYAVERLTPEKLVEAKDEVRTNRFFTEARLRFTERATLEDYKGSGFDRGHMAPAGDMPTAQAMAQSFSLANMVPQVPENNRGVWAKVVEKNTRQYVKRTGHTVYVFTGPVFSASPKTIGAGQVWVPSFLFKLLYDPRANRAWAHWVENNNDARAGKPISYQDLVNRTGINFLPGLEPIS